MSAGNYELRGVLASMLTKDDLPEPVVQLIANVVASRVDGDLLQRLDDAWVEWDAITNTTLQTNRPINQVCGTKLV